MNWFDKLKNGLARSAKSLGGNLADLLTKRKLDDRMLEDLEDLLIQADLGVATAGKVCAALAKSRYDKEISAADVRAVLAEEIMRQLGPMARPLVLADAPRPQVILMTGVNGAGKTTTIGKLASQFQAEGKSVMLVAGDTFRAAAIEQLQIWGRRAGVPVVSGGEGADPASLAFDGLSQAREKNVDVLLIDTAGRLQNKAHLMEELRKILRVLKKIDPAAPHHALLVLDATVGQNALSQVEAFREAANLTGLIMTKLDGTARGGVLVALAERFQLPIHAIGVGEGIDDLRAFDARDFANALVAEV